MTMNGAGFAGLEKSWLPEIRIVAKGHMNLGFVGGDKGMFDAGGPQ
jgi:hypothetical protein